MEFISHMQPCYDEHEIQAVNQYMNSGGWLTEFKQTRSFEASIAEYTNMPYCSVLSNGTVTLVAALMALGIKAGDEVIVPDFTMAATSHAVCLIGAKPVFVDVERSTFCMDFERMKAAITEKTRAVILVHMNGRYAEKFDSILEFCKQRNLPLVEDAAQALGSTCGGKALGTFGDFGSFSFSMPKIITTGQGGALITANKGLYEKVLQIRDFGRERTGSDHYVSLGANFKFTDIQAVIGIEQMKKMPQRVLRKKQICQKYDELLSRIPQVEIVKHNYEETVPCFYELLCENKDSLRDYLQEKGIGTRSFYPPLHSEPAYGLNDLTFPVAEEISAKGLWLPSSVLLTDAQIVYVCGCIEEYFKKSIKLR